MTEDTSGVGVGWSGQSWEVQGCPEVNTQQSTVHRATGNSESQRDGSWGCGIRRAVEDMAPRSRNFKGKPGGGGAWL